ncbi:MAG: hypothetical protein JXR51_01895 [Bacteroidales bacterium]|nr:hypothetical protein [Bacteroidales bacterium]MBN2755898.1 hypothetical protein [Bacteroidales bacterium]
MRLIFIQIVVIALISSCQGQNNEQSKTNSSDIHKTVVQEVIQTSSYTYLRVTEDNLENWLAVPKMAAELGKTYYYKGGMEMKNFQSKELGRSFETVYFLEKVVVNLDDLKEIPAITSSHQKAVQPTIVKSEVNVEAVDGGITIAQLFADKEKYAGKIVKIRGKVTKFNAAIMKKNWIHIQDGTENDGKFDLVATSQMDCKVGDIITVEGKIELNKDFGYGYSYEVLMEDAVAK